MIMKTTTTTIITKTSMHTTILFFLFVVVVDYIMAAATTIPTTQQDQEVADDNVETPPIDNQNINDIDNQNKSNNYNLKPIIDNNNNFYSELFDHSYDVTDYRSPLPYTYVDPTILPSSWNWNNVSGVSFLTRSLNQHLVNYCGSCWCHSAISSLGDRIKIAAKAKGPEINLSVQFILNCGSQQCGSCKGGNVLKTFRFIKESSGFIPFETCQPYVACSYDSDYGFCPEVRNFTTCEPINICKTCSHDGACSEIKDFIPNATIAEYGLYDRDDFDTHLNFLNAIKIEIMMRGPVSASLFGHGLSDYVGGIYSNASAPTTHTHAVSVTGWGYDRKSDKEYWIVRNSWGEYWGELGFCRIAMGQNILGIEEKFAWVTPDQFTIMNDYDCNDEDGGTTTNCGQPRSQKYVDPSSYQDGSSWIQHLNHFAFGH